MQNWKMLQPNKTKFHSWALFSCWKTTFFMFNNFFENRIMTISESRGFHFLLYKPNYSFRKNTNILNFEVIHSKNQFEIKLFWHRCTCGSKPGITKQRCSVFLQKIQIEILLNRAKLTLQNIKFLVNVCLFVCPL